MLRVIVLICIVAQISSASYAQHKRDIDIFDLYHAFGLGKMKGFHIWGYDWYYAHSIANSRFKLTGRIAVGTNPSRYSPHDLPMLSPDIGNNDTMRITNNPFYNKFGLALRYAPKVFYEWKAPIVPYFQIGFGVMRFRQNWRAKNILVRPLDLDGNPVDDWEPIRFNVKGSINQNWTWYGSATVGAIIPYGPLCVCRFFDADCISYFGFAIDYEIGGRLKYSDPYKYEHQFYYDSGLGEEQDRPFADWSNPDDLSFYQIARYHTLVLRLTFWRIEF